MSWIIELRDGTIVTSDKVVCMANVYLCSAGEFTNFALNPTKDNPPPIYYAEEIKSITHSSVQL